MLCLRHGYFGRCNALAIPGRSPFHCLLNPGMYMSLQACASLGRSERYLFQECLVCIIYMLNTCHVLSAVFFKQALWFWRQSASSLWLQSTGGSAGTAKGLTACLIQGRGLVSYHCKAHVYHSAVSARSKAGENICDFQTVPSLIPKVYCLPFGVRWVDRKL